MSTKTHSRQLRIAAIIEDSMKIEISELENGGDARGLSFTLPPVALQLLGNVADLHLASTGPRAVRGNHYHVSKREIILVLPRRLHSVVAVNVFL